LNCSFLLLVSRIDAEGFRIRCAKPLAIEGVDEPVIQLCEGLDSGLLRKGRANLLSYTILFALWK